MADIDLDKYIIIEDELSLEVDLCRIGVDVRKGRAKVEAFDKKGNLLSVLLTDAAGLYELAQKMLRAYDKLEGL